MKEMGIKRETDEIVKRAKEEAKKIDACKSKLRQSAMGGVITNSLVEKAKSLPKTVSLPREKKTVSPSLTEQKAQSNA